MSSEPAADPDGAGGHLPARHRWSGAVFLLVAIAMIMVDTTVVTIALPVIERDLETTGAQLQWISATYTLAFALTLVTAGRIGDMVGRKRTALLGIAGFVLASAVCTFAPDIATLLTGRVLQGLTGAFIITQGLSILQVAFPPDERATVLGLFGAVAGGAAALGPPLGGLLVHADLFGLAWRPVFLINLPIGAAALAGAALFVRESRSQRPLRLDPAGVALLSAALLALLYPLIQGRELDWPWWTAPVMAASLPLLLLLRIHQGSRHRSGATPLVPPELFRHRSFGAGLAVVLMAFGGAFSLFFVFSIYLQSGLGMSVLQAGLATMASPVATMAVSVFAVRLAVRLGPRVLTAGAALAAAGQAMLVWTVGRVDATAGIWDFVAPMLVSGIGVGLIVAPIIDIVLARVPGAVAGAASGLLNTADQLGIAAGVALVGTVFFTRIADAARSGADRSESFTAGLQAALWVDIGLLAASLLLTFLLPRAPRSDDAPSPEEHGDTGARRSERT
ncbi:MFS transporter [Streptomonospora salina]|uniref:EmrB/QacA subfamily drug resistance transporter n=1 Tax=Streptomonospora salina TaxID=104205 RepID=A0A841EIS0_9ACTN|nr:MFS transporter [Streptomonospora salina]MBB6000708.1 EmrB/QacA subfamily drug resistance transporter [Streptomonospora salina]